MRKYTFPEELEKLTPTQLDQLHLWLEDLTYDAVLQKLRAEFGVQISRRKLCQYNQRRELAEDLSLDNENLEVRDLIDLLNGEEPTFTQATLALISKKNFWYLLHQRDISVNKLLLCHRIATSRQTFDLNQRRIALSERRADHLYKPALPKPSSADGVNRSAYPAPSEPQSTPITARTHLTSRQRNISTPHKSPTREPQPQPARPIQSTHHQKTAPTTSPKAAPYTPIQPKTSPLTDSEWSQLIQTTAQSQPANSAPFSLSSPLSGIITPPRAKTKPANLTDLHKIKQLIPEQFVPLTSVPLAA